MHVAVLARDPETLDGLTDYLRAAGARVLSRHDLQLAERADVLVFFGDDFDSSSSDHFVREWVSAPARRCILVLVTSNGPLADRVRFDKRAVVLRRPVWGWVLLAAIQSALRTGTRDAATDEFGRVGRNTDLAT
jgi:DNA-binding response OmpR family regulator